MTRFTALLLSLFFVLIFSPIVSAEETTVNPTTTVDSKTPKETATEKRLLLQERKETMTALKEERKAVIEEKRQEFQTKIAAIKDTRKKALVEKIDMRMSEINTKRTTHITDALTKLSTILDRISEKLVVLKSEGKTTTLAEAEVTKARTAITTAQAAVTAQSEKAYVLTIADETTLKTTVGQSLSQLQNDLRTVRISALNARKAVVTAHVAYKQVQSADALNQPTITASPTASDAAGVETQ